MKKSKELPFKKKTKYVVERKVEGDKTVFWKSGSSTKFEPDNEVDERVASVIDDSEFVLEGYSANESFYASDVLFYDGNDLRSKPWPERYKVLKNNFRWNSAVKMNRPIVVKNKEEMLEAVKIFDMLELSEGVVIREYDSSYHDDKVFVPMEAI